VNIMQQTPSIWTFHRLGLLDRLDAERLDKLRSEGRVERWGHHATIHHEPDAPDVVAILRGAVRTRAQSTTSPILRVGDLFGATLVGVGAGERLMAEDDTLLVSLPRDRFDALVADALGNLPGRPLGWRGPRVELPLTPLLYTSAAQRLARALQHIGLEHGQQRDGALWLPIRWDQPNMLAPWLGLTPAALKQGMALVVEQGAIEPLRRGALVRDEDALARLGA
jgi:hypothetical protein